MRQFKRIRPKKLIMLTLAGMINAFGITVFLAPVNLYDSGISGTSMLLARLVPGPFSLSFWLLLLNMPLFLYGMKRQGKRFAFCAIYAVAVYSLCAWIITEILPVTIGTASPFAGTDLLLCALFGGLISGIGSGLAIRFGGAMDGVEVLAVIFAKRIGITVGTFVMLYNILLYIVCGAVFQSWILPLYSIITYAAALKAIDFIVDGMDKAKCAMIITTKPKEICTALSDAFQSGMTTMAAQGAYSRQEKTMIYFILNRFQVTKMREIVQEIDSFAYITISEVADVFPANKELK